MKSRKCNLELTLLPTTSAHCQDQMMMEMRSPQEQKQQPLTIFYNGTVCVSDVTELQARAIIGTARAEGEAKTPTGWEVGMVSPSPSPSPSSSLQSQKYSPTALSMKRSLRSFLQKRRNRIEATSPVRSLIN